MKIIWPKVNQGWLPYIAGNFHGVQFLRMIDIYNFAVLILADACTHAHYVLCN